MAALNFPNSPSLNDTYTANNKTFKWDGSVWNPISGENIKVFSVRSASNAAQLALLSDGDIGYMGGLPYAVDSSKTGVNSCTNDIGVDGLIPHGPINLGHFGNLAAGVDIGPIGERATDWMADNDSPNNKAIRGNVLYIPHIGGQGEETDDFVLATDWEIKARAIAIQGAGRVTNIIVQNGAQIRQADSIADVGVRWRIGGINLKDDTTQVPSGDDSEQIAGNKIVNGVEQTVTRKLWSRPMFLVYQGTRMEFVGHFGIDGSDLRKFGVALGVGSLLNPAIEPPDTADEGTVFAQAHRHLNVKRCMIGALCGGMRDFNSVDLSGSQYSQNWIALILINCRASGGGFIGIEDNTGPQPIAAIGNYEWDGWTGSTQGSANIHFGPVNYVNGNGEHIAEYMSRAITGASIPVDGEVVATDGDEVGGNFVAINETASAIVIGADTTKSGLESQGFTIYDTALFRIGATRIPGTSTFPRGALKGGNSISDISIEGTFGANNTVLRLAETITGQGAIFKRNNVGLTGWNEAGVDPILVNGVPGGNGTGLALGRDVWDLGGNRDNSNGNIMTVGFGTSRNNGFQKGFVVKGGSYTYDFKSDLTFEDNSGNSSTFANKDAFLTTDGNNVSVEITLENIRGLDDLDGQQQVKLVGVPILGRGVLVRVEAVGMLSTVDPLYYIQEAGDDYGKFVTLNSDTGKNYLSVNSMFKTTPASNANMIIKYTSIYEGN